MNKLYPDAKAALAGLLRDGMLIMAGGFGLCGIPETLIEAIRESGVKNLTVVSNNAGVDGAGLGLLLETRQIKKMISSYVGENKTFAQQYLAGELEIEFNPQGTLAERIRAGGAGIPAFYTATGVGTQVADGGLPWRYHPDGSVAVASPAKPTATFTIGGADRDYVLERSIVTDFALVRAWKGDRHGNLVFRQSARNFNPLTAMAGRITIAEVEHLFDPGELDPGEIHLPGVFVQRVVALDPAHAADKRVERLTTRGQRSLAGAHSGQGVGG